MWRGCMLSRSDAQLAEIASGIPVIVRRHAEEVATRWWRRSSAYIEDGHTRFDELSEYDQTIDAHLDGLKEAGPLALDVLQKALYSDAPDASADIFAALALAYLTEDQATIGHMLNCTDALPGKAWALQGVFAWNSAAIVTHSVQAHLCDANPRYRDAALAQCHTHGLSGGDHLSAILAGAQPDLVARALRTAGECGRVDLLPAIHLWLDPRPQARTRCRTRRRGCCGHRHR